MSIPRDTHVADRVGWVKLARVLSNVISPPTMFAATGLALGMRERGLWPGFGWGALYAIMISLTPMLVIVYLMRTGHIGDLHMSATHERHTVSYTHLDVYKRQRYKRANASARRRLGRARPVQGEIVRHGLRR